MAKFGFFAGPVLAVLNLFSQLDASHDMNGAGFHQQKWRFDEVFLAQPRKKIAMSLLSSS